MVWKCFHLFHPQFKRGSQAFISLVQGSQTRFSRATCGLPDVIVRAASSSEIIKLQLKIAVFVKLLFENCGTVQQKRTQRTTTLLSLKFHVTDLKNWKRLLCSTTKISRGKLRQQVTLNWKKNYTSVMTVQSSEALKITYNK